LYAQLEVQANNMDEETSNAEDEMTPRAFADYLATEHSHPESHFEENDLMRELIGVQVCIYVCV
jgi:hypothetical protein